ncbi:nuclear transport factor 2 family protein [Balneatrix alpica]|uniref:nuclear transport factor 2 family protein n=1 Tax=Balneatrix alpica TaxID=75684 RepID=UPI0027382D55|nr:nuclear transport factor 2 family protein [Balneatrix alpica]
MMEKHSDPRLQAGLDAYLDFFQRLDQPWPPLASLVTEQVYFADPFNQVQGRQALQRVLAHFVANVQQPRFTILNQAWSGNRCLLLWRFQGQAGRLGEWDFQGTSVLDFAEDGRVSRHQDFWDAGEPFYWRLPLLGWLIRRVLARLAL